MTRNQSTPYDHHKKAGNQGDVVKHTALIAAAEALMSERNGAFHYADTFAGYAQNPLRSGSEWKYGIGVIWPSGRTPDTPAVRLWRELWWCRVGLLGSVYPGSSTFILKLCLDRERTFSGRLWDISPSVVEQLKGAYKEDEAAIYQRPADPRDFSDEKPDLLLIDPPGLQTSNKPEYPRLADLLHFFGVVENAILWFPMTAGGEGAPEADTSRAARIACLAKGLWVTYVRWTAGAQVCGCQLAYKLPSAARERLQEAVDDVVKLMKWGLRPGHLLIHEPPTF